MQDHNYSAIILAGGHSSRMGYPKPWLKKENGNTFLAEIVTVFKRFGIKDVIVVLNEKFTSHDWEKELTEIEKDATVIKNSNPEKGRLYSLKLGLENVKSDCFFIHNVDNPFVKSEVLEQLADNLVANGITIPSYQDKGGHPVIINNEVKNEIINNYKNHKTLKNVFAHFPKKHIEVNSNSILKNINTPQELEEANYELS